MSRRQLLVTLSSLLGYFGLPVAAPERQQATTTSWQNVTGATGHHLTPKPGLKGYELRCLVTAHNSAGHATVHTPSTNSVK